MTQPPVHNVVSVLRAAEQYFAARGVEAPKRSAELLLGHVLGLDRLRLYLAFDRPLDDAERASMRALTARRGKGEPVAHLLGSWSFRGHELEVSKAVLVPRPETEGLVDLVLERVRPGQRVVDLGTGSGAIAIALAIEGPDLRVVAVDQSRTALEVARRNIERHGVADRVEVRHGSWWEPCRDDAPFDLVVSNPPYVDPARPDLLDAAVREHEPPLALFSGHGDPASCYREIAAGLSAHLRPGGHVLMETGVGAAEAALQCLRESPLLTDCELRRDLAALPRYLLARRIASDAAASQAGAACAT